MTTSHTAAAHTTTAENVSVPLAGRVAVVTGAGTGIGAATARALASRGASVAVFGRRADRIKAVADEVGGLAIAADVTDVAAITAAFGEVRTTLGEPSIVVANAGAMLAAPFEAADRDEWRRMLDVNVMGVLDTARSAIPGLLAAAERGEPADLFVIISIGARLVMRDYAVYVATKAAVTQLVRNLRGELGPNGVRVRAIEPGMTETDLGHDMSYPGSRAALDEFIAANPPIPAGAIAEAVAWSVSLPAAVNAAEMVVLPTVQG